MTALVSLDQAAAVAAAEVQRIGAGAFAVVEQSTVEIDIGWVFFYQSRRYLESGAFDDQLAGNGPLFVHRRDGSLHHCWSGETWEEAIKRYRDTGRALPPGLQEPA
jgi:hypothetical protein